jgi:6-phosphogluconolactonase (cycloisomerase 2 family)
MLIGTYTNGSSKGIYTFRFNQETGTAVPLSSAALPNPSYLVPSEDGEFVYAVSEMNDSTAALSSLAFDRETGELRLLNTVPTFGADPCYVATNGREVLTANYSGGTMSVFPLQKDGTLAPADTLFQGSATGPDAIRQATPHIHCTVFSPDGKYIFATDFSADRILRFVMHPDNLHNKTGIRFCAGDAQKWKEQPKREWDKYTFGCYGCWVMNDDGNLDYVPEEEYTEELWNEQKKSGERNRMAGIHK